ncbi:MAG TPA: hypothetical protein VG206_11530 [Terriglobia bacterium]|nr:hypothetical protein [Terriglobia bacterium]
MSLIGMSRRNLVSVAIIVAALVGIRPASAQNFKIGTATGTELTTCPSDPMGVSGTCWGLNISACPNPATLPYDATVKVTSPSGASIGTIIFLSGATGGQFYDQEFTQGSSVIDTVVGAGYTAVQIMYDNKVAGWLTGPATNGPLDLACLPSTSMQWVHDHILSQSTPLCATGNSGGSQQIAYALSQYGLGSGTTAIFTMVEPTSGPELSRLDYGCAPAGKYTACAICGFGTHQESYGLTIAETGIDPAYTGVVEPNGPCYQGIKGSTQNASLFHHDSTLSDIYPPILSFTTNIHFAFGGQDTSAAIPEGLDWASMITSATALVCVPTAGHPLASSLAGAAQIENDLMSYCRLPQP